MRNWYLYRHIRLDKNTPFYIGIGCLNNYHRAFEKDPTKRNIHWNRITSKTPYKVQIMFDGLTKEEASEKEKEFIKLYGRAELSSTGLLCNQTDGGDGVFGRVTSPALRARFRETKLGDKNPSYGKKQSQETCNKKSKSHKLRYALMAPEVKNELFERTKKHAVTIQAKPIIAYNFSTGEEIGEYPSISEGCRKLGIDLRKNGRVSSICKGKRNRMGNYTFKYKK